MRAAATRTRFVIAVTGLAFEARIAAGPGVAAVAGGGNPERITSALERETASGGAAIISFGVAGGLGEDCAPGTWIIADTVVSPAARWASDPAWAGALAQRLPGARRGAVAGVDSIVATPAEKRALHSLGGALAVDMESHIVAGFAAARGIPFAVFRVIADPAARALAPAAAKGMRSDGNIDPFAVLGALLRAPGQVPLLVRNARDTRTAQLALSRGRRLLGRGLGYPDL